MLEPENALVLDDDNGRAVGYLVGVRDTPAWLRQFASDFIPYCESQGITRPDSGPDPSLPDSIVSGLFSLKDVVEQNGFGEDHQALLAEFPAQFHIAVSPGYQRHGFGKQLIDRFCDAIKGQGAPGISLIIAGDNRGGEAFYREAGFGRFDRVLDGGLSGEKGRDNYPVQPVKNHVWLVKSL